MVLVLMLGVYVAVSDLKSMRDNMSLFELLYLNVIFICFCMLKMYSNFAHNFPRRLAHYVCLMPRHCVVDVLISLMFLDVSPKLSERLH